MDSARKRVAVEGLGFGVLAGVIVLAAEMVDSAMTAGMPAEPLRRVGSLVLGPHALDSTLGTTYLAGLVLALALYGIFGVGYAQFEWRLAPDARRHYGWQFGMSAVYAALLWVLGVAVSRAVFPWLGTTTPLRDLVIQTLFYGGSLGTMFAAAERRTPLIVRPSVG